MNSKTTIRKTTEIFILLLLGVVTVVISSGWYTQIPTDGHALMGTIAIALLLAGYGYRYGAQNQNVQLIILATAIVIFLIGIFDWYQMKYLDYVVVAALFILFILVSSKYEYGESNKVVDIKLVVGFFIFNSFFLLRYVFPLPINEEGASYFSFDHVMFNYMMPMSIFIAIYSITYLMLINRNFMVTVKNETIIALIAIAALIVLLYGQLMWPANDKSLSLEHLMSRPDGYLNANAMAAVALVLLFAAVRATQQMKQNYFVFVAIILATIIILLTQSRSSIIILVPFLFYLFYKKISIKLLPVFLALFILFALALYLMQVDIIKSVLVRFQGDHNSNYRLFLLQTGWLTFLEAPLWGNGYRHMVFSMGLLGSTHNEILQSLTDFGLAGFIVLCLVCYCFFVPSSIMFVLVCMVPMFLFSHNFFDNFAFQSVLGLALAVDRYSQLSAQRINR